MESFLEREEGTPGPDWTKKAPMHRLVVTINPLSV